MLVKLKKNFKFFTFIFLILFCFIFKISNAKAYVYQTGVWNPMNQYDVSGYVAGGTNNQAKINFEINGNTLMTQSLSYDLLVFKFNNMNFKQGNSFSGGFVETDSYMYCTKWVQSGSTFTCTDYSLTGTGGSHNSTTNIINDNGFSLSLGKIYLQAALYYNNNVDYKSTCFMSSDLQDMFLCPINKESNKQITDFEIIITNNGGVGINYSFNLSGLKYGFNYESTEIVNGLNGIQQQQVNTTTTIQNFNNYVSNNDTTEAETNQTTALGGISDTFNSHMSKANELTQFFLIPINFMVNIQNNTCKPLVWDIPFVNTRVQIPCMSTIYNSYFSTFISVFSLIMTSLLGYRSMLKLFNAIKGMVDAEDDKVEVVDL